jgi:dihydrofolate reductase
VYRQSLPMADTLLLTHVHRQVIGDTKFPAYDRSKWREVAREDLPECSFVEYARIGD